MDTIIFDIDGTLADVEHRRHHISGGKRNWDRFFEEMVNDPPLSNVCLLANLLGDHPLVKEGKLALFLFSGRPETYRKYTEDWLKLHVPSYLANSEALLMRAEGDYRPDTEVKREFLNGVRSQGHNVRFVVDDRPSVIQMWKDEGVTVLEHDSGDWDKPAKNWLPGKLTIMVGPSGAGKSRFLFGNPRDVILSTDELRRKITGDFQDQSANGQVFSALHSLVKARIESGLDTFVDATNLHARDRRAIRDICPANTPIIYIVIDRPLAEKHEDAEWRDEVIIKGEKLVDRHHNSFQSGLKHILAGDNDPRVTVKDYRAP